MRSQSLRDMSSYSDRVVLEDKPNIAREIWRLLEYIKKNFTKRGTQKFSGCHVNLFLIS